MYSQFWHTSETAGPSVLDVARVWDREPRILRTKKRAKPQPWNHLERPIRLIGRDASQVAAFWKKNYKGSDWYLDATDAWVQTVLSSSSNIAFGVYEKGELIGTILSRPASKNGKLLVGDAGYIYDGRVIEGLCIHPKYRGQHLAGWLIAWMDYTTDMTHPTVHFWFREVPLSPVLSTEICGHTYGYVRIADLSRTIHLPVPESVNLKDFQTLWENSAYFWRSSKSLVASLPFWEEGDDEFWEVWKYQKFIVVLQNTRRKSIPENQIIWEVAWVGTETTNGQIRPRKPEDVSAKNSIEAVAIQKGRANGILFVTDAPHQGGATSEWGKPWIFGTSGKHLTYIYNFMPPTFWYCDVQMLRLEV